MGLRCADSPSLQFKSHDPPIAFFGFGWGDAHLCISGALWKACHESGVSIVKPVEGCYAPPSSTTFKWVVKKRGHKLAKPTETPIRMIQIKEARDCHIHLLARFLQTKKLVMEPLTNVQRNNIFFVRCVVQIHLRKLNIFSPWFY